MIELPLTKISILFAKLTTRRYAIITRVVTPLLTAWTTAKVERSVCVGADQAMLAVGLWGPMESLAVAVSGARLTTGTEPWASRAWS